LVKERAHSANVRLDIHFDSGSDMLRADERKMKQILINLISNSIKFTHAGGQVSISVHSDPQNGFVFEVADTGIGIAPGDIEKALQPFGQIDSDLNRKYAGTGLGLPLASELAEIHDGKLELRSELNVGTTVTMQFPIERTICLSQKIDDLASSIARKPN
ncbi:MAG: ATP-binding protein, partial [Alphaproteobacteria bacterium]|nr:ATP-binding protein [Alphaproteobacteria bacterium]